MAGMTFFIALFSKVVSLVFINLQGSETSPFSSFLVHEKMNTMRNDTTFK